MSDAPTEMEMRVTHAICESGLGRFSCGFDGKLACYCGRRDAYLVAARVAIRAMREPTKAMCAARNAWVFSDEPPINEWRETGGPWQVMIDAASPTRPEDTAPIPVGLPRENEQ